ncbi:hypothetical protein [Microbulbifer sp. ARAS458-1]|uniref:hypothetical protein n=1 Tax=Microbulbifer sp. ARAS458-1 TaxID=3140242 RepID=UPI0038783FAF
MRKGVSIKVDGLMVLTGAAVVGAGLIYWQGKKALSAVNPSDPNNVINRAVTDAVGEDRISNVANHIFGAVDLVNPWAPDYRKDYAKQIYGIE